MFPHEMEADMALFMKHCSFLQVPRTKEMLKKDVVHFVKYKNLDFPRMPDDGPGKKSNFNFSDIAFSFLKRDTISGENSSNL